MRARNWFALAAAGLITCAGASQAAATNDDSAPPSSAPPGSAIDASAHPDAQPLDEVVTLRVGYIPALSQAPVFLAEELGFYADENLEVELEPISSISDALLLLAQGDIDVYTGAPSAPMFNQVASGLDVRMISSIGSIDVPEEFDPPSGVYVRQELIDSGEVSSAADLAGRKIAALGPIGTATSFLIHRVLATGGVELSDVELVILGFPEAVTALETGAVDAAFLVAPFSAQVQVDGIAAPIVDSREAYGDVVTSGQIIGPTLLENRQAAVAFLRADMRAAQRMQGDYREDEEVVAALASFMDTEVDLIRNGPIYYFDPTLRPQVDSVMDMQDVFLGFPNILSYTDPLTPDVLFDLEIQQLAAATVDG
jgi:NitT/TauT family transport system substrate-binding protein